MDPFPKVITTLRAFIHSLKVVLPHTFIFFQPISSQSTPLWRYSRVQQPSKNGQNIHTENSPISKCTIAIFSHNSSSGLKLKVKTQFSCIIRFHYLPLTLGIWMPLQFEQGGCPEPPEPPENPYAVAFCLFSNGRFLSRIDF